VKVGRASIIVVLLPIVAAACAFDFEFDAREIAAVDAGADGLAAVSDGTASEIDSLARPSETSTLDAPEAASDSSTNDAIDGADDTRHDGAVLPTDTPSVSLDSEPPDVPIPADTLPPADTEVLDVAAEPDTVVPLDTRSDAP